MSNKFELKNRDEVILFEKYLHNYCQKRSNSSYPQYISLVPAYEQLHSRKDGGRIFTALLDHRRKKFNILAKEITVLNEELILQINQTINEFDNKFRTSEAHGTGVLRKWTFLMESMDENPQIEILKFWNAISKMVGNIGRLFYPKGINDSFILIK